MSTEARDWTPAQRVRVRSLSGLGGPGTVERVDEVLVWVRLDSGRVISVMPRALSVLIDPMKPRDEVLAAATMEAERRGACTSPVCLLPDGKNRRQTGELVHYVRHRKGHKHYRETAHLCGDPGGSDCVCSERTQLRMAPAYSAWLNRMAAHS